MKRTHPFGLSLEEARQILDTALAEGRSRDLNPLAVAILDAGGHVKLLAREDGAGLLRPDIAIGKAWGTLGMGLGSRSLAERAAGGVGLAAFFGALNAMATGKVVPAPGGVLVRDAGGTIRGAVGVSGADPDEDEACAVAGIRGVGLNPDPGA